MRPDSQACLRQAVSRRWRAGPFRCSVRPTPNLVYTIMTAQQGVSGTFANVVAPSFVFLSPELSYTPTSVLFSLQQTRAFTSAAATPNQASVAAALGALPVANPLFQAVLMQASVPGSQQAFDALSGEIHASTRTVMLDDSRLPDRQCSGGCARRLLAARREPWPRLAPADRRWPMRSPRSALRIALLPPNPLLPMPMRAGRSRPRRRRPPRANPRPSRGHRASAHGARSTATGMPQA